ncbi:uncharacterized protein BX663DRAFT_561806, partial [Cokeromyces recurvatus]|uniref:uncharacterized protein n=1 Tax=Cokeromyces recurvatus TaxID=90255 RepID=UPI002220304A
MRLNHPYKSKQQCMPPLKKQKEPTHGLDEKKKEIFVIKCSLKNICRDSKLIDQISLVTAHTTKVMWVRSLFINYLF